MDKQALIDEAVEKLNGKFPESGRYLLLCKHDISSYVAGEYSSGGSNSPDIFHWDVICDREQFTQRAKEKGFINGFEWGKEYPTNGKNPDLPFDLLVEVNYRKLPPWQIERVSDALWHSTAYEPIAFRIVDTRFKPKQPESHSKPSSYTPCVSAHAPSEKLAESFTFDNSWHEKGELPPVGTVCEVSVLEQSYLDFEVRGYYQGKIWLASAVTGDIAEMVTHCKFRPIKSEREKFVEAAIKLVELDLAIPVASDKHYFESLYDAGCRFVSQESSS